MTDKNIGVYFGTTQQSINHMRKNSPQKYKCVLFGATVQDFGVDDLDELKKILELYTLQKKKQQA